MANQVGSNTNLMESFDVRLAEVEQRTEEDPKASPNWIKAVNEQFSQIQRRLTPLEGKAISQEDFDNANRTFNETLRQLTNTIDQVDRDAGKAIRDQAAEIHALAKLVKALTQELISLKSEALEAQTTNRPGKQEVETAFKQAAEASREAWTNRLKVGSWMTCTQAAIACGCTVNAIRWLYRRRHQPVGAGHLREHQADRAATR